MVLVNGEAKTVAGMNLKEFLAQEGYDFEKVVVERNLDIIPRTELDQVTIEEEDTIEVLRFVGGG
ncbi:MAG: sulfur carrier protein ThiS [Eubacteriales bacterium]|nr:sulfur carrier protein ThiS [Eubacteriales bacterium]